MFSSKRVISCLLFAASFPALAAEVSAPDGAIEISVGETVFFQLADTTVRDHFDKIGSAIRVQDPNRENAVVRATLEVGEAGTRSLKVRNGYSDGLVFRMNAGCSPEGMSADAAVMYYIFQPGNEVTVQLPASTGKLQLCDFRMTSYKTPEEARARTQAMWQWLQGPAPQIR